MEPWRLVVQAAWLVMAASVQTARPKGVLRAHATWGTLWLWDSDIGEIISSSEACWPGWIGYGMEGGSRRGPVTDRGPHLCALGSGLEIWLDGGGPSESSHTPAGQAPGWAEVEKLNGQPGKG